MLRCLGAGVRQRDGLGSDGQVVTLGLEAVLIGGPGQSDLLAFGRDVVRRSLVGVARVVALAVAFLSVAVLLAGQLLLGVGFVAGRSVRSGVSLVEKKWF